MSKILGSELSTCQKGTGQCTEKESTSPIKIIFSKLQIDVQTVWGWGHSSVVELLPSLCKALGQIPSTVKTKPNQNKKNHSFCSWFPLAPHFSVYQMMGIFPNKTKTKTKSTLIPLKPVFFLLSISIFY